MTVDALVRMARLEDVDRLAELRLENARVHVELDPLGYRVPDAAVVRAFFTDVIRRVPDLGVVLVAEVDGRVVGSVEVVPYPEPPAHQILRPTVRAYVHTVVAQDRRGAGVGGRLLMAAEAWAAAQGVQVLVAGIVRANEPALSFYGACGYREQGVSAVKQLEPF